MVRLKTDPLLDKRLPPQCAAQWMAIPVSKEKDGTVCVGTPNPSNAELKDNLQVLFRAPVRLIHIPETELRQAIENRYGLGAHILDTSDASIVRFVNDLIARAIHDHATDIHIEPYESQLQIRFRIDGLLHPIPVPPALAKISSLLISRIKVMAHLNIAEKRRPQDGRIKFKAGNQPLDIRLSTIPTLYGESLNLRLLYREHLILGLEELGMSPDHLRQISKLIRRPNGILLVTGPTGHGKTTTLYAGLSQINSPDKKIITIEDPIEYNVKGINQIQTHSKVGLTFASGLRSILRQDPDVIMVGEIRDAETAEIAIRASPTGHLVFSTLHTTSAVGSITRLLDMGVEPYLVVNSLNAVLAQRLVRLSCPPCDTCRGTGFRGRTGLFEFLTLDDEFRDLILKQAPAAHLHQKAKALGMETLYENGQRLVAAGKTTEEEIHRVLGEL